MNLPRHPAPPKRRSGLFSVPDFVGTLAARLRALLAAPGEVGAAREGERSAREGERSAQVQADKLRAALAELALAQTASRRSATLLRAISDSSTDAIFAKDREGRMLFANPATLALIGKPLDQVLGRTDAEFLDHPETAAEVMNRDRRIMESGVSNEVEEIVPLPDGTPRVWLSRKTPFRDAEGQIAGLLGISRDITDRKHMEIESGRLAEQRQLALDAARMGWWHYDPLTRISTYDRRYTEIFGVSGSKRANDEILEMLHPNDLPHVWAAVEAALDPTDPKPYNSQYRIRRPDGRERWIEAHGIATFQGDGAGRRATGLVGTVEDITDRKHAEEERERVETALRESEEQFRSLFEHLLDGYAYCRMIYDGQGNPVDFIYLAVNSAFTRLTGLENVVGRRVTEVIPGIAETEPELLRTYGRVATTGQPERFELHFKPLGIWLAISVYSPRKDHFVAVFDNISDRKNAELERETLVDALRVADRRKNEFLAVLSHELRNPLAPIRNSVYILEHAAPGGEQASRARQVIDRQAQHMTRLIDDLLDVTRIARGKINLQRERLDLVALARGTAEDHREIFARRTVKLVTHDPGDPIYVDGDRIRLAQVIGNLLNNSIKFTPSGGQTDLIVETVDGRAVVRVRDTGEGMSGETLERLFEPFMQADQTIDRSRGGLGLGLALVKGLVEMHGGTISASSDGVGRGSEFRITLPLAAPLPARLTLVTMAAPERRRRRVLVIEDNTDAAESLREALELGGHEVVVAFSGPAGLETAHAFRPDMVICDIGLPGLDGYGVAQAIRADPALRSTFLVALSGYALHDDIRRSTEAGFDRHLAKPPAMEQIENLIAEMPDRLTAG